ncbi:YeeE/YedE family protein [Stappia stellulata]|uniref:YeeE/YedE family protein n=1 Tax=Stappia TaxID=152161 RepID=UPI001CD772F9|nr:YeeE/YedE family protein [Stappia stellulata]MCA1242693.1 YeeE/YedE family protein [Stappia stellulata]|eukprot:jgi/Tetstr1/445236/TSEL_033034.t1
MTEFTPVLSATGGILIGLASVMLMAALGRIAGISGMIGGLLPPVTAGEWGWRLAFLAGMIAAPVVLLGATGSMPVIEVPSSTGMLVIGGILVGIGVSYGSGCTSGHGVCGMARLSARSIAATLTFMLTTGVTVFVIRHVIGG